MYNCVTRAMSYMGDVSAQKLSVLCFLLKWHDVGCCGNTYQFLYYYLALILNLMVTHVCKCLACFSVQCLQVQNCFDYPPVSYTTADVWCRCFLLYLISNLYLGAIVMFGDTDCKPGFVLSV